MANANSSKVVIGLGVLAALGGLAFVMSSSGGGASSFPTVPRLPPANTNGPRRRGDDVLEPPFVLGPIPGVGPGEPPRPRDGEAADLPVPPPRPDESLPPPPGERTRRPPPTQRRRPVPSPSGRRPSHPGVPTPQEEETPLPPPPRPRPAPRPRPSSASERTPEPEEAPEPAPVPGKLQIKPSLLAGGKERRNAAIAVVGKPETFPPRERTRGGKDLGDWLADVAFWSTYPDAPTTLDPKSRAQKKYVQAWVRIRAYVGRGLTLEPQLGAHPINPAAPQKGQDDWRRWALAVAFATELRTAEALRSAFAKAWNYCLLDVDGVRWVTSLVKKSVSGHRITLEGLMADAAVWLSKLPKAEAHAQLLLWPQTATKAFGSANQTALEETQS